MFDSYDNLVCGCFISDGVVHKSIKTQVSRRKTIDLIHKMQEMSLFFSKVNGANSAKIR